MIQTLYLVRCEGPCQQYLTLDSGVWRAGADYEAESWPTTEDAEQAARAAGWIKCNDPHDIHCYDTVCPDCRAALSLAELSRLGQELDREYGETTLDEGAAATKQVRAKGSDLL